MLNVGPPELLLILLIALLVLGPNKLPDAARQVGRAMAELRRLSSGFQAELRDAMQEPVQRSATPLAPPPPEPGDHEAMNATLAAARDEAVAAARPERRRQALAAPAAKQPGKKPAAKKASGKKASGKKASGKKAATKKVATKKTAAAKKASTKKATAKRAPAAKKRS